LCFSVAEAASQRINTAHVMASPKDRFMHSPIWRQQIADINPLIAMSALPPKADMCGALADVCFGPTADIQQYQQT
jgi:hypothetical protein